MVGEIIKLENIWTEEDRSFSEISDSNSSSVQKHSTCEKLRYRDEQTIAGMTIFIDSEDKEDGGTQSLNKTTHMLNR